MKKVLIITYYWPPGGGAGVQRWLKFVKYLRDFGWEPVIYTPENPESPALDQTLAKDIPEGIEVLKVPIKEPYTAYKRFVGRKKDDRIKAGFLSEKKKPSITEKIAVWVRGNFFIPDARKFWVKPSVKFLSAWLQDHPVDVIVSTGPPHSMHLIAMAVSANTQIPWVADFRDPWTKIDFYKNLMLTKNSDRKHHFLEREVLQKADQVIVVGKSMAKDFAKIKDRYYHVITNGFDDGEILTGKIKVDQKFSVAHIGSMGPARNPRLFWQALDELLKERQIPASNLEIKLIGQVDYSVSELLRKYNLDDFTSIVPYLSHEEVLVVQRKAQLLLLVINETPNAAMVITGKIFEYLSSGRPILCIGPVNGDAAAIINETQTGFVYDYNDLQGIKKAILNFYTSFKEGKLVADTADISIYTRRNLTSQLSKVLDSMIGQ